MQTARPFDFISRTQVWIERTPGHVWPLMLDLARWKTPGVSPQHLSGPLGQVGEVVLAGVTPQPGGAPPERLLLQTLRLEPPHHLLWKLWTEGGADSSGYVEMSLVEARGGALFTYAVNVEMRGAAASGPQAHLKLAQGLVAAERRFDEENQRLKMLAESTP